MLGFLKAVSLIHFVITHRACNMQMKFFEGMISVDKFIRYSGTVLRCQSHAGMDNEQLPAVPVLEIINFITKF